MSSAKVAAQTLLDTVGHHDSLDSEVMEYICSIIEDPDPDSCLEVLPDVLAEYVSEFAALSNEQQVELVLKLLDDAKSAQPQASISNSTQPAQHTADSMQAVVAALRQANLQCQQQEACSDITNRHNTQAAGSHTASSRAEGLVPDLSPLLELSPAGISSQYLQHCLQQSFHGDMQAAANWLLETTHPELLRQQDAWLSNLQQQQEEWQQAELEKQLQKKMIVAKFDLRVVSDSSQTGKKAGRHAPDLLQQSKKGASAEGKVRYRDDRVVSTRGEKIIIEKVGEEWDGGSRGKVYTKGKRGKGFH